MLASTITLAPQNPHWDTRRSSTSWPQDRPQNLHLVQKVEQFEDGGRRVRLVRLRRGLPLAPPAVDGDRLFVGEGFGSHGFHALDAETLRGQWAYSGSDPGPSAPALGEGVVAYNTESCTLFAHDQVTGERLWSRWLGDPQVAAPAIGAGLVVTSYPGDAGTHRANAGHRLAAFDLRSGSEAWVARLPADVVTRPVIQGDQVLATTAEGTVSSFDLRTGEVQWRRRAGATSAPRVAGGNLWFARRVADGPGGLPREGLFLLEAASGGRVTLRTWGVLDEASMFPTKELDRRLGTGTEMDPAERQSRVAMLDQLRDAIEARVVDFGPLDELIVDLEAARLAGAVSADQHDVLEGLGARLLDLVTQLDGADPDLERALEDVGGSWSFLESRAESSAPGDGAVDLRALRKIANQRRRARRSDAGVGFSRRPPAARLDLTEAHLGVDTVRGAWEYQGARPTLTDDAVLMPRGGALVAYDRGTGTELWSQTLVPAPAPARPVSPAAIVGDLALVGTSTGSLVAVHLRDGRKAWWVELGGRISAEPVVHGGAAYVVNDRGVLARVELDP